MKAKLLVTDLVPPNCGSITASSTRYDESWSGAAYLEYRLVYGDITGGQVLLVPDINRLVRCWHCTNLTHRRWVKRDSLGYAEAVEAVCPVCYDLRLRGLVGEKLQAELAEEYARWRAAPLKYADRLGKWTNVLKISAELPWHVAAEAERRRENFKAMLTANAAAVAKLMVEEWPVPDGWVLTTADFGGDGGAVAA